MMHKAWRGWPLIVLLAGCAQARQPAPATPLATTPATAPATAPSLAAAPIDDMEPDVTRQVAALLAQLDNAALAPEQLGGQARADLGPAEQRALGALLRPCGGQPALALLARSTRGEVRQYRYRATCAGALLLLEIDLGKGARINRLQLRPA